MITDLLFASRQGLWKINSVEKLEDIVEALKNDPDASERQWNA